MKSDIGDGLRSQREQLGLSLRAVASAAGISPSMLSQVETGKLNPSVSTLYQIASYLDVSVDALLGLKSSADRVVEADVELLRSSVQRAGENPTLELTDGVTWEKLAAIPESHFASTLVTYAPGAASSPEGKMARHVGYEFGYLTEGSLTMHLGFQQTILKEGDSFSIDAEVPHLFVNHTDATVRGIWFVSELDQSASETMSPTQYTQLRREAMNALRNSI